MFRYWIMQKTVFLRNASLLNTRENKGAMHKDILQSNYQEIVGAVKNGYFRLVLCG